MYVHLFAPCLIIRQVDPALALIHSSQAVQPNNHLCHRHNHQMIQINPSLIQSFYHRSVTFSFQPQWAVCGEHRSIQIYGLRHQRIQIINLREHQQIMILTAIACKESKFVEVFLKSRTSRSRSSKPCLQNTR